MYILIYFTLSILKLKNIIFIKILNNKYIILFKMEEFNACNDYYKLNNDENNKLMCDFNDKVREHGITDIIFNYKEQCEHTDFINFFNNDWKHISKQKLSYNFKIIYDKHIYWNIYYKFNCHDIIADKETISKEYLLIKTYYNNWQKISQQSLLENFKRKYKNYIYWNIYYKYHIYKDSDYEILINFFDNINIYYKKFYRDNYVICDKNDNIIEDLIFNTLDMYNQNNNIKPTCDKKYSHINIIIHSKNY